MRSHSTLILWTLVAIALESCSTPEKYPGVQTDAKPIRTPSGLAYIDIKTGTGPTPIPG